MTEAVEFVRPDIVIHLAGEVRGARTLDAVRPTLRTNLLATVELLEAVTRLGCRRVVLSGSLLEEPAGGGRELVPSSPYGASRFAASAYGRMFCRLSGTPVVILPPVIRLRAGPGTDEAGPTLSSAPCSTVAGPSSARATACSTSPMPRTSPAPTWSLRRPPALKDARSTLVPEC